MYMCIHTYMYTYVVYFRRRGYGSLPNGMLRRVTISILQPLHVSFEVSGRRCFLSVKTPIPFTDDTKRYIIQICIDVPIRTRNTSRDCKLNFNSLAILNFPQTTTLISTTVFLFLYFSAFRSVFLYSEKHFKRYARV